MTTTLNAVTSTGLVQTSDGSGVIKVQSNGVTTNALAWVNFGYVASAVTVRAQYNVSSVVRNSTGNYTINFANALTDTNYVLSGSVESGGTAANVVEIYASGGGGTAPNTKTTSACAIVLNQSNTNTYDFYSTSVMFFGN